MSHQRYLIPILTLVVLVATGCSSLAKQKARSCVKAEQHLAKAVYLCPASLISEVRVDTVTVTVEVPGSIASGEGIYHQYQMDSLVMLCSRLLNNAQARVSAAEKRGTADALRRTICSFDPILVDDSSKTLRIWSENNEVHWTLAIKPRKAEARAAVQSTHSVVDRAVAKEEAAKKSGWKYALVLVPALLLLVFIGIGYMVCGPAFKNHRPEKEG